MGDLYTVTIPRELRSLLSESTVFEVIVRALNRVADDVCAMLKDLTPKYTGETASRWKVTKHATAADLTVHIVNDSEVAIFIEFGTGIFATEPIQGVTVDLKGEGPPMRPRFVVRGNLPRFEDLLVARVKEELEAAFSG